MGHSFHVTALLMCALFCRLPWTALYYRLSSFDCIVDCLSRLICSLFGRLPCSTVVHSLPNDCFRAPATLYTHSSLRCARSFVAAHVRPIRLLFVHCCGPRSSLLLRSSAVLHTLTAFATYLFVQSLISALHFRLTQTTISSL